jgi:hypothetical protein
MTLGLLASIGAGRPETAWPIPLDLSRAADRASRDHFRNASPRAAEVQGAALIRDVLGSSIPERPQERVSSSGRPAVFTVAVVSN